MFLSFVILFLFYNYFALFYVEIYRNIFIIIIIISADPTVLIKKVFKGEKLLSGNYINEL